MNAVINGPKQCKDLPIDSKRKGKEMEMDLIRILKLTQSECRNLGAPIIPANIFRNEDIRRRSKITDIAQRIIKPMRQYTRPILHRTKGE